MFGAALAVTAAACRRASPPDSVNLLAASRFEILRDAQTIDLGSDDPDTQRALVSGWSRRETGWNTSFAWVDGPHAALRFFASSPRDTAIRFRALAASTDAPQEVAVSVNHRPLVRLQMPPEWTDYEVVAPADAVQRGDNLLEFEFATTTVPLPGDGRYLAAAFDAVQVRPKGVASAAAPPDGVADGSGPQLRPGMALRTLVGAAQGASIALDAKCEGLASGARLVVWAAAVGATGDSTVLWDDSVCTGTGAGLPPRPVSVRRALPADAAARELYVGYEGNAVAPPLRVERLALERPRRSARAPHPNVVLIVLDALRADHVHAYGYARQTTPSLDAFAADAMLFANAFAQGSQTITAVPSILTGTYPLVHGAGVHTALSAALPTLAERLSACGYATAAVSANPFFGPDFGLDRGFGEFVSLWKATLPHARGVDDVVRAESVLQAAIAWLVQPRAQPFFLVVHFMQPHLPYAPPAPYWGSFGSSTAPFTGREVELIAAQQNGPDAARALRRAAIDRYDDNLLYVDAVVGQLLAALARLDLIEPSVTVITADHGEQFFEHGQFGHPVQSLYDESLHVPLLIRAPGRSPGRTDALVESADLGATVLDLTACAGPLGHGRSLVPLLDGRPVDRHSVMAFTRRRDDAPDFDIDEVRSAELKLIRAARGGPVELFDLRADPGEQHNAAAERPADVAALQSELDRARASLQPAAASPLHAMDATTRERLRALGYLRDRD